MLSNQQRPDYLNHAHDSRDAAYFGSKIGSRTMRGINNSGQGQQFGGADKKPSKLEQMRVDYQKKILKEKEEKMVQLYEDNQKKAIDKVSRTGSGGQANGKSVREFFKERRLMEAAGGPIPPIDNHYRQAKGYSSPGGWSSRTGSGTSQRQQKVSAGRDRSQPLAPIQRPMDTQEVSANNHGSKGGVLMKSGIPTRQQMNGHAPPGVESNNAFNGRPVLIKHKPLPPTNGQYPVDNNNNDGMNNTRMTQPSQLPKYSPQHKKPPQNPQTHARISQPPLSQQPQQRQLPRKQQQSGPSGQLRMSNASIGTPRQADQSKMTDFQKWQLEQNKARENRLKKLNSQKNIDTRETGGYWGQPEDEEEQHEQEVHGILSNGYNHGRGDHLEDDDDEDEDDAQESFDDAEDEIARKERVLIEKIAAQQMELENMRKAREREEEEEMREREREKKREAAERARQKKLEQERKKNEERQRKLEEEEERQERKREEKRREAQEQLMKEQDKRKKEEEKLLLKIQKEEEKMRKQNKQTIKSSPRKGFRDPSPTPSYHDEEDETPIPSPRQKQSLIQSSRSTYDSSRRRYDDEPTSGRPDQQSIDDIPVANVVDTDLYLRAAASSDAKGSVGSVSSCKNCGRKFATDRLKKHQNACTKASKPRKEFDASKKRVEGTELAKYAGKSKRPEPPKKKSNWRAQHNQFIEALRYAKKMTKCEQEGGDVRKIAPPPSVENPDLVPCPHCGRSFNETAAERHIPRCKDLKTRPPPMNTRRR